MTAVAYVTHHASMPIASDPTGVRGSEPPQKFCCGIFYGLEPQENFTEVNLIINISKIDTNSGFVRL